MQSTWVNNAKGFYGVTTVSAARFEEIASPFAPEKGGKGTDLNVGRMFKNLRGIWLVAEAHALFEKAKTRTPIKSEPMPDVPSLERFRLCEETVSNATIRAGFQTDVVMAGSVTNRDSDDPTPTTTQIDLSQGTAKYIPRNIYMKGGKGALPRKKPKTPTPRPLDPIDQGELEYDILFLTQLFSGASDILDDFSCLDFFGWSNS